MNISTLNAHFIKKFWMRKRAGISGKISIQKGNNIGSATIALYFLRLLFITLCRMNSYYNSNILIECQHLIKYLLDSLIFDKFYDSFLIIEYSISVSVNLSLSIMFLHNTLEAWSNIMPWLARWHEACVQSLVFDMYHSNYLR